MAGGKWAPGGSISSSKSHPTPVSGGTGVSCMSGMRWASTLIQHMSLVLSPCPGQRAALVPWGQAGFLLCLLPSASWGVFHTRGPRGTRWPEHLQHGPIFPAACAPLPGARAALGFLPQRGRSWADGGGAGGAAGLGAPVQRGQAQLGTEGGPGASRHSGRAQH